MIIRRKVSRVARVNDMGLRDAVIGLNWIVVVADAVTAIRNPVARRMRLNTRVLRGGMVLWFVDE